MRNKIILAGLIAAMTAAPANAAGASKEEGIGVSLGATIGAFAGGPAGFIVGAAIGAKLGDQLHQRDEEVSTLR